MIYHSKILVLVRKGCAFYETLYQEVFFWNPGGGGSLTVLSASDWIQSKMSWRWLLHFLIPNFPRRLCQARYDRYDRQLISVNSDFWLVVLNVRLHLFYQWSATMYHIGICFCCSVRDSLGLFVMYTAGLRHCKRLVIHHIWKIVRIPN